MGTQLMRTFHMPKSLSSWEALATIIVAQNAEEECTINPSTVEQTALVRLSACSESQVMDRPMTYDLYGQELGGPARGFRRPLFGTTNRPFPEALAQHNDIRLSSIRKRVTPEERLLGLKDIVAPSLVLKIPRIPTTHRAPGIVVCPYAISREMELPVPAWQSLIAMLRTYGKPVYLMADPNTRFDAAMFAENDILSNCSVYEKAAVLAASLLVVGVPNAWLWMATVWNKNIVYFYPETVPSQRWFWHESECCGRCLFDPAQIDVAVVQAGARILINSM